MYWEVKHEQWYPLDEDDEDDDDYQNHRLNDPNYKIEWPMKGTGITLEAWQEGSKVKGWRATISLRGNIIYDIKVYIDQFPDLLVFLRYIQSLEYLEGNNG